MTKWVKYTGILVAVSLIIIATLTTVVLAQGPENDDGPCDVCGQETGEGLTHGWRFNRDDGTPRQEQGPFANGEPPCDDFVDEDGDGVCDLCGEAAGDGLMRGWQFNQDDSAPRQGRGALANDEPPCDDFVDQDGDGVCDNHDQNERTLYSGTRGRGGMGGRAGTN